MATVTLWNDEKTGVEARREKGGIYAVFTPTKRTGLIVEGTSRHYATKAAAIKAARRKARDLLKTTTEQ